MSAVQPSPNPWWGTPEGAAGVALALIAVGTGGLALEAEGGAAILWTGVSSAAGLGSAALDAGPCLKDHQAIACGGLILDAGSSLAGIVGASTGSTVVLEGGLFAAVTGASLDLVGQMIGRTAFADTSIQDPGYQPSFSS
jgi:hypothetical protein